MASLHQHPSAMPPMSIVANLLAKFDRSQLSDVIESAIARLDRMDPDPDIEANGDELDGAASEDDFWPHSNWDGGAGCPLSDPGGTDCEGD